MVQQLNANGPKIKQLREAHDRLSKQLALAQAAGISEKTVRRFEKQSSKTNRSTLKRLATALGVSVEDIAYSSGGPKLVQRSDYLPAGSNPNSAPPVSEPEFQVYPRMTTTSLTPVSLRELLDLVGSSQRIVPHVQVSATPNMLAIIEELLGILDGEIKRNWYVKGLAQPDEHDAAPFPAISRSRRIGELLVMLKGNDIRVMATMDCRYYAAGETPWLAGQTFETQLVIAFAPPRGEYDETTIAVPFDQGRDLILPQKPPF